FQAQIDTTFLKYSYISQIVTVSSYSLVYSNQNVKKASNSSYIRFNLELSGNALQAISKLSDRPKNSNGAYTFFDTEFSQFVRSDINLTYHQVADENNSFAYRLYIGVGYPYGNSRALPFEKRFFTGGANGVRAWQARSLGPGSYYQPAERFPNRTADIKIEANFEYRFRMVWKLEGAMFIDCGNIWSMPKLDDRTGATFEWNKFYEQIAIGSGLGIRLNLGFFILRTDFGYKIFDPAINPNEPYKPWVPFNRKFSISDITFNFGIGYPF
ncbi:MAG TPA: BamA/TamA family outer membrane protein, partial [Tenuifilum sp.]|nr:BamA/TamA family outer membrane protein [Tenuifilum sp.]HRU87027.1 BamA/TamA family outer membrane protein [Tenuifilum sp.]